MWKKIIARIKCVSFKADPDYTELWSGGLTLTIGLFLLLPIETFSTRNVYSVLEGTFPEPIWGVVFCIVGAVKILCYLVGNFSQRRACLAVMAILWTYVTTVLLSAWYDHPWSVAPIFFVFVTLAIIWAFVRVGIMKNIRENLYGNGKNSR